MKKLLKKNLTISISNTCHKFPIIFQYLHLSRDSNSISYAVEKRASFPGFNPEFQTTK